jgi:hypothetical protein
MRFYAAKVLTMTKRLRIALNSCARSLPPRDPISAHTEKILGLSLTTSIEFAANFWSPSFLSERLQLTYSLRTLFFACTKTVCGPAICNRLPITVRNESREGKFRTPVSTIIILKKKLLGGKCLWLYSVHRTFHAFNITRKASIFIEDVL